MNKIDTFRFFFLNILILFSSYSISCQIAKGGDVGWLSYFETTKGIQYVNDNGVVSDALQIMKDHDMNAIRLRAFVNPTLENIGKVDTQNVVQTAIRANNLGMDVMITIHYSDVWADPGSQHKPAAWENLSFNDLAQAVYDYTYGLMDALLNAGVTPKWVQVGNETNPGFLWEDGRLSSGDSFANMNNYVALSNRGYDAIKTRSPSTKVITHLASGNDTNFYKNYFDAFYAHGGKNDIIGVSYYPRWNGSNLNDVGTNLNNLVKRFDKDVMICEIGNWEYEQAETYNLLVAAIEMVESIENSRGLGVLYWEPIAHSSINGYQSGLAVPFNGSQYQFSWVLDAFENNAENCVETTMDSYVKINDLAWEQTSNAIGNVGDDVKLAPSSQSSGSWQWRGPNNFSATSREIEFTNVQKADAGNYVVTYTPASGCPAQITFNLNVLDAGEIYVENPGFEDGVVDPWVGIGNFGVDTDLINSGTFSGWFGGGISELSQTLKGLKPNTTYEYSCYIRNWSGDSGVVSVGVKSYGANPVITQVGMTGNGGNDFELAKVTFTTGSTNTSAVIYAATTKSQTWGKIDDARVVDASSLSVMNNNLNEAVAFQMYPNPASDEISLVTKVTSLYLDVKIFSILGIQVLHKRITSSTKNTFRLPISNLNSGAYILRITSKNGISRFKKLVIE